MYILKFYKLLFFTYYQYNFFQLISLLYAKAISRFYVILKVLLSLFARYILYVGYIIKFYLNVVFITIFNFSLSDSL
jgi:hypothetical protein